jgi:Tannase and feruloyl esterase
MAQSKEATKLTSILIVILATVMSACSGPQSPSQLGTSVKAIPQPVASCASLIGAIPSAAIGLPSNGAIIRSAQAMSASVLTMNPAGPTPASLINPAKPDYCQVMGSLPPIDPKAPAIEFQINLPTRWNGRSVQFGGGGFNGVLINALTLAPGGRFDEASPLGQGFVTYGTDSGHQNKPNVPPQDFALNEEALTNFAFASYKKVRDVAFETMKRYYGQGPNKLYFVGSSEGGREGLLIVQRYPNDFDGVFSRVPVVNWVGLQMFGTRSGNSLAGPNWINANKVQLVAKATLAVCDSLDGVRDEIVSDFQACAKVFDASALRCPNGADTGDSCLSDGQINAIKLLRTPLVFAAPLANGLTSYPGYSFGGEGIVGAGPTGGWTSWWSGRTAPLVPPVASNSITWFYGAGAVQYFFAQDANYDAAKFSPTQFPERLKVISQMMDSTNPDLSAFRARGGKLIMKEHIADYAQSPNAGFDYFKSVQLKMGDSNVREFARLYVAPGVDHVGSGAPANINMLDLLVNWVEKGQAPGSQAQLVHVEQEAKPPFNTVRARPMCEYPLVPRFKNGDVNLASSFQCEK